MNYEGNVIRPPSEANSIILQVTVGCSHNRCTFCGAYKDVRFRIKSMEEIDADLDFAGRYRGRLKRVFLADGDVLILPQPRLVELLEKIRGKLDWITRIGLYANARSILHKTPAQLDELKKLGLDRVYLGLESGHDPTLKAIRKGVDAKAMIRAGQRVRAAGIFLSVTVLLGIAGRQNSRAHAAASGRVLSAMAPNQIAALTLMLLPNTPLHHQHGTGEFELPDRKNLLAELRELVAHITLDKVQFQANHASNYLPVNARLCRDKETVLSMIDRAIVGEISTVPEYLRAL
ncbi:MAG: radical SAM protein [Desulfobacterales bacterium]|nr:radical SAM protein [Desulfobacterales bacterium]